MARCRCVDLSGLNRHPHLRSVFSFGFGYDTLDAVVVVVVVVVVVFVVVVVAHLFVNVPTLSQFVKNGI